MVRKAAVMAFFLLGTWCVSAQPRGIQMTDEEKMLDAMHRNITSEKLFGYVKQFSDPALEGRLAGSPGMAKAAGMVKEYFADWGLLPIGDNGGYIQEFSHPCVEVQPGSSIEVLFPMAAGRREVAWLSKSYPWADGWFAGGTTGNGDVTADVVYCGFGVTAPELGYDDYAGMDVKGKIVLVEGETPNRSNNPDTLKMWYHHTLHQTKLNNAVAHGAAGLLYKWVPGPNAPYNEGFVYAYVTDMVVDDIFNGTGKSYKETVDKIYKTKQPQSFHTGKRARIKMNATYNPDATGKNVVGMVKGCDPELADEYVIIAGHLDHLGMIPYHIEGANDNNSAVSVLLGVAEAMAKCQVKPKRSIIFMTLDGEEAGLTGSTYYTKNPIVPKDKVKAVINLEQVGVGEVLATSYNYLYPHLAEVAKEANAKYVHRRVAAWENYYRTRPRTDGAVFMQAGYPCMDYRATGGRGFYHHPADNTATINPEILQSEAEWLFWSAIAFANEL